MSYSEDFLPDPTFTETKSLVFSHQQSDKNQSQGSESSTARNAVPALVSEGTAGLQRQYQQN